MSDEIQKAKRALQTLGRRVRHGLTRTRPVSDRHLAQVREAVRRQWEQQHGTQTQVVGAKESSSPRKPGKAPQQHQSKSRDKDHGHGHSH